MHKAHTHQLHIVISNQIWKWSENTKGAGTALPHTDEAQKHKTQTLGTEQEPNICLL